jgi:hypothetical protein
MVGVRHAAAADAAAIAVLMTQLGYPCSVDDAAARLGYWLADPMSRVLVAERGGVVIGCLPLHALTYLERTGRWARIESLVVGRSARGTRAGAALMSARKGRRAGGGAWRWRSPAPAPAMTPMPSTSAWALPTSATGPGDSSKNSGDGLGTTH